MIRSLPLAAVFCTGLTLLSCSRSGGRAADNPVASSPSSAGFAISVGEVLTSPVVDPASGSTQEAVGVYWLERDATDPGIARLTMVRQAATVGDHYALSIRPFMTAEHLRLLGTTESTPGVTDYQIEFRHPIPMPTDLQRPATATRRTDLFLFDVQVVLVAPGEDLFFNHSIRVNTDLLSNADGYRHLAPLVQLSSLGITDGTNLFPYKLLYTPVTNNPVGNYAPANGGWNIADLRTPTGYDVVPQGSVVQTTLTVPDDFEGPVGIVLTAKYSDPRRGNTVEEKRANRLPDPGDFGAFAYALPEACGDLQIMAIQDNDGIPAKATVANGSLRLRVLDWDSAAPVATSGFPNVANLSEIRQASMPSFAAASIPVLDANGLFIGEISEAYGQNMKYRNITIDYQNHDYVAPDPLPPGTHVGGLIRIIDAQDAAGTSGIILTETQMQASAGPYLNARYQAVKIPISEGMVGTYIGPTRITPGRSAQFFVEVTNGPATGYEWLFGDAMTAATSSQSSPTMTATMNMGTHACSVRIHKGDSFIQVPFDLEVALPGPVLPTPLDNYASLDLPRHYTDPAFPGGGIIASSNMPENNITTDAGATLGRVLFYDTRLSQNFTKSCASCHKQSAAFSDTTRFSRGFDDQLTHRNSMGLTNCGYYVNGRMFADERAFSLEAQAIMPIQDPKEMGMTMDEVRSRLTETSFYPALFNAAFGDPAITDERIGKALAQFMRSIVSYRSKFDQALAAGPNGTPDFEAVLTDQELTGLALFMGHPSKPTVPNMRCDQCHVTGAMIQGAAADPYNSIEVGPFKLNNGLGVAYYEPVTEVDEFKSSSLRNIEKTAPYMHDGRFSTLGAVVSFYSNGVQNHANLHRFLRVGDQPGAPAERFNLSASQQNALVAFLKTLTDEPLLVDPKYSDPFPAFE